MPIFCYECDDCGELTEVFRHAGEGRPAVVQCACGGDAARSYAAEIGSRRKASCGEIRSVAAGVMPDQAADAQRQLAARGIDVRFDRATGDAIFADRRSRLRALRVMGLHDRNEIRG